jgi:single-strand DNA-binding protein
MSIFTLNRVELIGNIGADLDIKTVGTEAKTVVKINIATTESYKDVAGEWIETTDWHKVVMWNRLAERAQKNLHKGSKVYISGKLKTHSYETEGVTKYVTEIIADNFIAFESRNSEYNQTYDQAPVTDGGFDNDVPF